MKLLKALGLSLFLTFASAVPTLGDETCVPGDMHGPPCLAGTSTSSDPTAPGETQAPPAAPVTADLGTLAEIALHSLLAL